MAERRGAGIAGVAAALLFTIAGPSSQAETSAAPVYVSIQDSIGASTPHTAAAPPIVGGLVFDAVAWLASRGVNKQSAVKVDRFNKSIGSFDFAAEARRAFGCADPNECHEGMAFTDPELFQAAFDRNPAHRGVVIDLTPELNPTQMMIRAVAREFERVDGKSRILRVLTTVYTVRSPLATSSNSGKQPPDIEKYWSQGEPANIVVETRRGMLELSRMLARLGAELGPQGDWPKSWSALPKVKTLRNSGRVKCSGMDWCAVTYVYEDAGDHLLLVEKNGLAMGWFDAKAAATETNLPAFAQMGLVGNN
jgi:hypothetical protein